MKKKLISLAVSLAPVYLFWNIVTKIPDVSMLSVVALSVWMWLTFTISFYKANFE